MASLDLETQVTVTLREDLSKQVRERVAADEYPTEEALVLDSLRDHLDPLLTSDDVMRHEVLPALERLRANPSSALSSQRVRANIVARHERSVKAS